MNHLYLTGVSEPLSIASNQSRNQTITVPGRDKKHEQEGNIETGGISLGASQMMSGDLPARLDAAHIKTWPAQNDEAKLWAGRHQNSGSGFFRRQRMESPADLQQLCR